MLKQTALIVLILTSSVIAEVAFRKRVIETKHKAEGAAVLDVNRDGKLDIVAGDSWYEAPEFKPHVFRDMLIEGGYANLRCDFAEDVNNDGWDDVLTVRRYGLLEWFENPKGRSGQWTAHKIGDATLTKGVIYGDVTGDGKGEFVGAVGGPNGPIAFWTRTDDPEALWQKVVIGETGGDLHGIGIGDINGDHRTDILTRWGWYEAPTDPIKGAWPFHELERGMTHHAVVYDFNSDTLPDIVAGAPHDYGLYYWERVQHHDDKPAWLKRTIDDSISQLNSLEAADIDGDGDMDLVTGKRYYAHNGKDPGADEPAMLVWFELDRTRNRLRFHKHVIDDDSGIGYTVTPCDIDRDGDMDIVSANKKGVFLFEQKGTPPLEPLFNGKDLSNWTGDQSLWSVEDGEIVGKTETGIKHNSFLISKEQYGDFVLTLDVKLTPDTANSGIQFRSVPSEEKKGEVEGYQADIGKGWWGSIYEELGRAMMFEGYKRFGQHVVKPNDWNHYVIRAIGQKLTIEINGTICVDAIDYRPPRMKGHIAFQIHSGGPTEVRFRNIKLRRLD